MMTFNEQRHWEFPLVPTDCAYAKLGGYFGNCENRRLRPCKRREISGAILEVRKVNNAKNRWLGIKMEKFKAIVSDLGDTIRNTFVRMANSLSGSEGPKLTR